MSIRWGWCCTGNVHGAADVFAPENLREYPKPAQQRRSDRRPPRSSMTSDPIRRRRVDHAALASRRMPKLRPSTPGGLRGPATAAIRCCEILAAGEDTPSPEVVAAAGETQGTMKTRSWRWRLLAAGSLMCAGRICLDGAQNVRGAAGDHRPPERSPRWNWSRPRQSWRLLATTIRPRLRLCGRI